MALTLWLLGYPVQTLQRCRDGLALAQQLMHPYSRVFALVHLAQLYRHCGAYREALDCIDTLMSLVVEYDLEPFVPSSQFLQGWALTRQGQIDTGIRQMQRILSATRDASTSMFLTRFLAELAIILERTGQPEAGLRLLDQGLAIAAKSDGHFYEAERYRFKGELLLQQTVSDERQAELCFFLALDIAREQAAKTFELRAAVSQSRLWRQQGRPHKAHNLLAPIYDWFTEGVLLTSVMAIEF